jgi:deoxyhypusine synthase
MSVIRQYTNDEALAKRVLERLGNTPIYPDDPFCQYNVLILILLEELRTLRDEQLYSQMLNLYKKDLDKVVASLGKIMQRMLGFFIGTATLIVVIAFAMGFIFAKIFS